MITPDRRFPHATRAKIEAVVVCRGVIMLQTVPPPPDNFGAVFMDENRLEAEQNADKIVALWNASPGVGS